jgi:hypothetical protein
MLPHDPFVDTLCSGIVALEMTAPFLMISEINHIVKPKNQSPATFSNKAIAVMGNPVISHMPR